MQIGVFVLISEDGHYGHAEQNSFSRSGGRLSATRKKPGVAVVIEIFTSGVV